LKGIVVEREAMAMKTKDKEREEEKEKKGNNQQDHVKTGAPPQDRCSEHGSDPHITLGRYIRVR